MPLAANETRDRSRSTSARKNPCGSCADECASGNAVVCGFCQIWFHVKCVEGMTPEFLKCCDAISKYYGGSSFLCVVCRKVTSMLNHSMKEMGTKVLKMETELATAKLEHQVLAEKVVNLELKSRQVEGNVQKMEGEVALGMVKAKEEVKDEMRDEMKERESKKENIVVYGLKESDETDGLKRKDEDVSMVIRMATEIGVDFKGEVKSSFRAGKKEGERPRPLIVTIEDEETRENILTNARRMSGKDEWKRVFVSHDLTWRQREEARKEEKKVREEAEKKTEEENNGGRVGKYVVVGPRGGRRLRWVVGAVGG